MKAFTNALFKTYRNLANYGIVVLNLATVDAPGVIISQLRRLYITGCISIYDHVVCTYLPAWIIIISAWALTLSVQLQ